MKSNSKNFERVDNRGGQLENCFHQRERERESSAMLQIYRRNAQVSIAVILVVLPLPQNCTPNSSQFPYTNFHPYLSCLYRGYLFVHVSPHSNHGTNALHHQNYRSRNDRFLERSARFDEVLVIEYVYSLIRNDEIYISFFFFIPYTLSSRMIRSLNSIHFFTSLFF